MLETPPVPDKRGYRNVARIAPGGKSHIPRIRFSPRVLSIPCPNGGGFWRTKNPFQHMIKRDSLVWQCHRRSQNRGGISSAESDRELVLAGRRLAIFNAFYRLRLNFNLLATRDLYAGFREDHQGLRPVSDVELALEG